MGDDEKVSRNWLTKVIKGYLIVLVEKKHIELIYHIPWLYQYPPLHFHWSYKKIIEHFEKLPPLDHGGPEMKCTYFHRNCWKKIA